MAIFAMIRRNWDGKLKYQQSLIKGISTFTRSSYWKKRHSDSDIMVLWWA
jgi:hypothetical protein